MPFSNHAVVQLDPQARHKTTMDHVKRVGGQNVTPIVEKIRGQVVVLDQNIESAEKDGG
jgi:hypothetical protein